MTASALPRSRITVRWSDCCTMPVTRSPSRALIDVEDLGALGITQALQDDLLCGLRTDATEVARRVLPTRA